MSNRGLGARLLLALALLVSVNRQTMGYPALADLNGDGIINHSDYHLLGPSLKSGETGTPTVDFNADGRLDFSDALVFSQGWFQ